MVECAVKEGAREIRRLDVETPLGVVHLAGFTEKPDHRSVIFEILSEYAGSKVAASDLVESKDEPRPAFPKLDFDVNWTHSGGYCVLAYGKRGSKGALRLGVDLERYSPRRLHLAKRFFSPEEASLVEQLKGDAAEAEFFKLWCRKEAFYKCVGGDFFEGTLRRDMQKNPLEVSSGKVHFIDMEGTAIGAPMVAALCVAVAL